MRASDDNRVWSFFLCSKVFDFWEACRSASFSPRHLQARENNPVTFHRPAGAQRLRRPARKKNDPPCDFMMFSMGDAQKHSPSSTSPCRTTGTPGTRPSMSPSRRTICSTWPFVDGVRHAGSMKETARITDGSAATYRCLISINARTIYVVVWAALVYRSQACVWRRRWNYVFSSKGLDYFYPVITERVPMGLRVVSRRDALTAIAAHSVGALGSVPS